MLIIQKIIGSLKEVRAYQLMQILESVTIVR
jgi:hypothetical protein